MLDKNLLQLLHRFHQKELLSYFAALSSELKRFFYFQLQEILKEDHIIQKEKSIPLQPHSIAPFSISQEQNITDVGSLMEKLSIVILAAGDGTRLGMEGPKACIPIFNKTLVQLLIEKIRELQNRYQLTIPIYFLLSKGKGDLVIDHLIKNHFFGLERSQINFLFQKDALFIDHNHQWVLKHPLLIGKGPAGNGELIFTLKKKGVFPKLKKQGKDYLFIAPIDNPCGMNQLELLLSPFQNNRLDLSAGVIKRISPEEKLGIPALYSGKYRLIDYPHFPKHEYENIEKYPYGNTGLYIAKLSFLSTLTHSAFPFHKIEKKMPLYEKDHYHKKSIFRFERFITDMVGKTKGVAWIELDRELSYCPIKTLDCLSRFTAMH